LEEQALDDTASQNIPTARHQVHTPDKACEKQNIMKILRITNYKCRYSSVQLSLHP